MKHHGYITHGNFLAEGYPNSVDGWTNTKDFMNDHILCPRCNTVVTYDEFTQDILGVCCSNCYGKEDL